MRSATIESHLSAIKYFHLISRGFELDTIHLVIASDLKRRCSFARRRGKPSNRASANFMVDVAGGRASDNIVARWGSVSVAFSVCNVLFLETRSRIHQSFCLRQADVAFFWGDSQLVEALWSTDDRAKVRFRGSKGDQFCERGLF